MKRSYEQLTGLPETVFRDGKRYVVTVCPADMNQARADAVAARFRENILPGGSLCAPEYAKSGGVWRCTDRSPASLLDGYDARIFPLLPPMHRQRIALGMIHSLYTLHRAGLCHGSLGPESFRVTVAQDGSFRVCLTGFACAGPAGNRVSRYMPGFNAPETGVSEKTDVYALGAVLYFLLCGRVHARGSEQQLLVPDCVPEFYRPLLSAMLCLKPERRPSMQQVVSWTKSGSVPDTEEHLLVRLGSIPKEEAGELIASFRRNQPAFKENMRGKTDYWDRW